MIISALFRDDIAPDGFLHRHENVVALGVDALGVVAQNANAFDDVEFARPLPEGDARGLPRLGQNLRREDLEMDKQDVLVVGVELNALDEPCQTWKPIRIIPTTYSRTLAGLANCSISSR